MFNALSAYKSRLEGECTCTQDVAHFLMEIVQLQGRVVRSYGRICHTMWMMIDEGLLLFTRPDGVFTSSYKTASHLVWVPDVACEESPTIKQLLVMIALAGDGSIIDEFEYPEIRIEVGLMIERIVFLRNDSGLHAYPPNDVPPSDSLDGYSSESLWAFGLLFSDSDATGYLSLVDFHLFIQGPDWRYSGHRWFKMESRLAIQPYAYYVLFVSRDYAEALSTDSSDKRHCLFIDEMHRSREFGAISYLIHEGIKNYDWEGSPYFNNKEAVESTLEVWRVILSHSDWKGLYKELCKDKYETCSEYSSWPKFCKEFEQADYQVMREGLHCLYDWVSVALDAAGGLYAYFMI